MSRNSDILSVVSDSVSHYNVTRRFTTPVGRMDNFDPLVHVSGSTLIFDDEQWPTFHDAVRELNLWRGDMRRENAVYIGPSIEAPIELVAFRDSLLCPPEVP